MRNFPTLSLLDGWDGEKTTRGTGTPRTDAPGADRQHCNNATRKKKKKVKTKSRVVPSKTFTVKIMGNKILVT